MSVQEFPISVIEKLGYYVYVLRDPTTDQIFYVGKGIGNRVFAHANAALVSATSSEKLDKIRAIHDAGLTVKYVIHRHGLTEKEAFEVEAALIDYVGLDQLTNLVAGYNSDDRGRMSVPDIIAKYAAPEVEILEPSILITVNRLYRPGMSADELYEITRGDWSINLKLRDRAKYAFTVYRGLIREVYRIDRWTCTKEREGKKPSRWRFDGPVAMNLQHYVGGSTARYPSSQWPLRALNCGEIEAE
jgi:uncharacterized protein